MKRILLLNGNPDPDNGTFDDYCDSVTATLAAAGNEVRTLLLRDMKIGDCIGCYGCWLKTPGVCVRHDDHVEVLKGYVWGDLAVLASPVRMGFVSAQIKKAHDRMIPLVHTFLTLNGDRMAHLPRYEKTARVGLLIDPGSDTGALDIIGKVYEGAVFLKTMERPAQEVAHEIDGI